jgi:hypothetical protein
VCLDLNGGLGLSSSSAKNVNDGSPACSQMRVTAKGLGSGTPVTTRTTSSL